MTARQWSIGLAAAGLLLAGCGSNAATTSSSTTTTAPSTTTTATNSMPGMSMAPGQTMAPGETMPASPGTTGASSSASTTKSESDKPSKAALMVCSADIKGKVKQVLSLPSTPVAHAAYKDHRYTCTYDLPMGPLVLSVQDSTSPAAARTYFTSLRSTLGKTDTLIGLGADAYGTPTGTAVVLKDSQTLVVDATGLPSVFGSQKQKRTDLAYEVASDVLGCWTEGD